MIKSWADRAWNEYLAWQENDKKVLKRINALIKDIDRNGNEGIGKPEALKGNLAGLWSRRIAEEHRLIYRIKEGQIEIFQCIGHYDD